MTWLTDNLTTILEVLGILAGLLAVAWWMTRERRYAYAAGGVAGLGILVALVALLWSVFFGVSDSRLIEQAVQDMADNVGTKNVPRIFAHVSDEFKAGRFASKAALQGDANQYIQNGQLTGVVIWDMETRDVSRKDRKGKAVFMVKAHGPGLGGDAGYRCQADFVLDKDGQWRMASFALYPPHLDPSSGQSIFP